MSKTQIRLEVVDREEGVGGRWWDLCRSRLCVKHLTALNRLPCYVRIKPS